MGVPRAPGPGGPSSAAGPGRRRPQGRAPAGGGLFLVLLAVFALTNAGRLDIIDGQVRWDVSASWLDTDRPIVRDPFIGDLFLVRTNGGVYAGYNAAASVTPMPLMLLSRSLPGHTVERDRFAFTMAGPVFGAAVGALLVVGYGMLGVGVRGSLVWAAVATLATLWWPASVTVFDQNQHAFFALASVLLAWQAARRRSVGFALVAGLVGGLLATYQENYALLFPFLGLPVLGQSGTGPAAEGRTSLRVRVDGAGLARYVVFGAGSLVGLALFAAYNHWRFGSLLSPDRYLSPILFSGNPLAGFLSLSISPGKGILLFSPPLLLALVGVRGLLARAPFLAVAVTLTTVVHLLVIVQLSFFGGDWCWGPRYLVVLVPLWALAFPFAVAHMRRALVIALVALGLAVQLMAVSLDHQRFFFEHNLPPFFWLDQWAYFKRSQLLSRPAELWALAREGVPAEARQFSPTPRGQFTYTPGGPPDYQRQGALWARHFSVFHTFRPWPVWLRTLPPGDRPVDPRPLEAVCALFALTGMVSMARAVKGGGP